MREFDKLSPEDYLPMGLSDAHRQYDRQDASDKAERGPSASERYILWRETSCYVPGSITRSATCVGCLKPAYGGTYTTPSNPRVLLCLSCFDKRHAPEAVK